MRSPLRSRRKTDCSLYGDSPRFAPRGTEVELPDYFAKREDLLSPPIQEIDILGVYRKLQGWIVHVVRPEDPEKIDRSGTTHPNLQVLVEQVAFP